MTERRPLFRSVRVFSTYDMHEVPAIYRTYRGCRGRYDGSLGLSLLHRLMLPLGDGAGITATRSLAPDRSTVDAVGRLILDIIPEET